MKVRIKKKGNGGLIVDESLKHDEDESEDEIEDFESNIGFQNIYSDGDN